MDLDKWSNWFKKPLASSLLSLEAISKDYYSIFDLLVFLSHLSIRVEKFFHQLIELIVIFLVRMIAESTK